MREFVYLSDQMVSQFAPSHAGWWNRMRLKKLTGSVGVGATKVAFESSGQTSEQFASNLGRVTEHIQDTALWYQDPAATAGGWVFFDAPLAYWNLARETVAGSTIFFDVVPTGTPATGRRRLFLQAATEHLTAHRAVAAASPRGGASSETATRAIRIPQYPLPQPEMVWGTDQLVATGLELEDVMSLRRSFLQTLDRSSRLSVATSAIDWLINEVADDPYTSKVASWMAGCARTLAVHYLPRSDCEVVVATPLYIERVPPAGAEIE